MNTTASDLIHIASNQVRREFPLVDLNDLRQEGTYWCVRNPTKLTEYIEHEDPRQGEKMLYTALRNRMRYYAQRQVSKAYGYSNRADMYQHYTEAQIREELLPCVFDRDSWESPPAGEESGVRHKTDPAIAGTWKAMLADVADAYRRLPKRDREMVEMRFRYDAKQKDIATVFGLAESSVSEAIDRAIGRMHRHLGGDRPAYQRDEVVGSRRVMSNAQAQALTARGYDGE